MKNRNLLFLFALIVTAALFLGPSTGQTDNYANAPGDTGTCANCHSGGTGGGSVVLSGMPATYTAGQTYPLTLFIFDADAMMAGYQIVATDGTTNAQIGTFQSFPANSQLAPSGRLIQNAPASFLGGAVSWSFNWVAPSSGSPSTVTFYYVGNSVDNSGSTSGDFVYSGFTTSALPVELADFSAKIAQNGMVQLDWKTFSETNNDRFSIERCVNDGEFQAIGSIKGHGTTTEPQSYQFRDQPETASNSIVKYRLNQFDFDGNSAFSKIVTVEIGRPATLEIWPNIAQDGEAVRVYCSGFEKASQIKVIDFSGKTVFSQSAQAEAGDSFMLPTDGWPSGQFVVKISDGRTVRSVPFLLL